MKFNFSILNTNLKLLEFNHKYPKEFSQLNINTFSTNKPNENMMCIIILFLITKFNELKKEKFNFCYPVTTLKELKDFKEIAFHEIINILNENNNDNIYNNEDININLNKSILDAGCGERLILLMRNLSDKVLQNEIRILKNINNSNNNLLTNINSIQKIHLNNLFKSIEFQEFDKKIKKVNLIKKKDKLIKNSKKISNIQTDWKNFASHLENELNNLEKEKLNLQKKYKNFKDKDNDNSIYSEIATLDRAPKLENLKLFRQMTSELDSKLEEESEFMNNLEDISEMSNNSHDTLNLNLLKNNFSQSGYCNNEEVLFIHEKVKDYNKLIENSIDNCKNKNNKNSSNSNLDNINDELKKVINSNEIILYKIGNLINELS